MAKAFGDAKLAKKFDSLPLSNQTLHRRVIEQAEKSLVGLINKKVSISHFALMKGWPNRCESVVTIYTCYPRFFYWRIIGNMFSDWNHEKK